MVEDGIFFDAKKQVHLFVPCQNAKGQQGENRDAFIPNPAARSASHLAAFEFVGKLMGIAIRTKTSLDLKFPSAIWKSLISCPSDVSDLQAMDETSYLKIRCIESLPVEAFIPDSEGFSIVEEWFTCTSYDSTTVLELKPNGSKIRVVYDNRLEYSKLLVRSRLSEMAIQCESIKSGIGQIISLHHLSLFDWKQLEERVCGRSGFDIELLKKRTVYSNVSVTDRHIQDFWSVLEQLTPEQQRLFIRFVWGRSKLPRESEFNSFFTITTFTPSANSPILLPTTVGMGSGNGSASPLTIPPPVLVPGPSHSTEFPGTSTHLPMGGLCNLAGEQQRSPSILAQISPSGSSPSLSSSTSQSGLSGTALSHSISSPSLAATMGVTCPDLYLPHAQTCFFTLSLPAYSSREIMRMKLLYAIVNCKEIDADFIVRDY